MKPQPTAAGHKRAFADPDASVCLRHGKLPQAAGVERETEQQSNVKIVILAGTVEPMDLLLPPLDARQVISASEERRNQTQKMA